jgi:hypothetical protein
MRIGHTRSSGTKQTDPSGVTYHFTEFGKRMRTSHTSSHVLLRGPRDRMSFKSTAVCVSISTQNECRMRWCRRLPPLETATLRLKSSLRCPSHPFGVPFFSVFGPALPRRGDAVDSSRWMATRGQSGEGEWEEVVGEVRGCMARVPEETRRRSILRHECILAATISQAPKEWTIRQ